MTPIEGRSILSAAAMRAAEDRAIAAGSSVGELMERAGAGVAEAVRRLAGGAPVLILCGPGNNGGDGYVAARVLRDRGVAVRVAALAEPGTEAAIAARAGWNGPVAPFPDDSLHGPVVVDAVFGTGLSRPVEPAAMAAIDVLVQHARLSIAVDLPSGVDTDTGAELNRFGIPRFTVTLALGALKPAHLLQPAAAACGATRLIDIGLGLDTTAGPDATIARPYLPPPQPWMRKYTRGLVAVIGGAMPGASALAVEAAMRAGAGYGLLFADATVAVPHAVVRRDWSPGALAAALDGKRHVAVVVGPGLGRDAAAADRLEAAIASGHPLVIDGDALHLLGERHFASFGDRRVVLTPHEGEFRALFGDWRGSKIDAARDAARRSGATVVFKGPDTVVAHPDGHTNTALPASAWLSTAGTGDVLAGIVGAMIAAMPHGAAEAAVWMHGEAARRLGGAFIADDLVRTLSAVRAAL